MTKLRRSPLLLSVLLATATAPASALLAQDAPPRVPAQREVYLIQQDSSGCNNADVKLDDWSRQKGTVLVMRGTDGITRVKVGFTGAANTSFHFFLKCVRLLGDIKTEDEGQAQASFEFPTNSVGDVFGFDMYPEGAPSGRKYQSMQVSFQ
jgi:hypothetical protein